MPILIRLFLSFSFSLLIFLNSAAANTNDAPRFAILIGNADYPAPLNLPNPVNDARAMASVLAEHGFQVQSLENGTLAGMRNHLKTAVADIPDGSVVLFYFAGHAIQKNGVNWLLPLDFEISKDTDVSTIAIGIDEVLTEIDAIDNVTKIVVMDACRDYPLGEAQEAFGNGLTAVISQGETLVAYATLAGEVASDGAGPNSPYTGALVSALDIKGMALLDVFRTVRYKVRSATQGQQLPWVSGSLSAALVLNEDTGEDNSPELQQLASLDPIQAVHWDAISRSSDPSDFRTFMATYAETPVRAIAQQRADELARLNPDLLQVDLKFELNSSSAIVITACDYWASDPLDPKRLAPGVAWGLVNTRNAIRDCSVALANDPENPRLAFLLARSLDIAERFDGAHQFYLEAAQGGYGAASRNLGFMYRNARGVPADDELAARFYLEAAEDGIVDARKALAKLYEEGWGVDQSYDEMMRWLELSAEEDYPNSLDHLGNLYRTGEHVTQDYAKAKELYERGASVGYGNAIANLARVYRDGLGVTEDRALAMELYQTAVDSGNAFAPYHLGRMLLDPKGDEVANPERALALLTLSAERGYGWSFWQLARSWRKGDFGEADLDNAAHYLWLAAEAGRSMRTKGGQQLVSDATELLKEVEPELSQDRREAVERRTQQWLKQNSLLNFSLIFPY